MNAMCGTVGHEQTNVDASNSAKTRLRQTRKAGRSGTTTSLAAAAKKTQTTEARLQEGNSSVTSHHVFHSMTIHKKAKQQECSNTSSTDTYLLDPFYGLLPYHRLLHFLRLPASSHNCHPTLKCRQRVVGVHYMEH